MGRKMIGIWTAVGVLAAVFLVTVPVILHIREKQSRERTAEEIRAYMEAMDPDAVKLQQKLARWYNLNLSLGNPEPDFRRAYEGIFNLGQGRMGLLEITELGLTLPITHGTKGAAGHDPSTALPVEGQGNHTVLYLQEALPLTEGMRVHMELPETTRYFRVESIQVMPMGWSTDCPSPGEMLTLVHDWGNRRMIARCVPGQGRGMEPEATGETLKIALYFAAAVILLAAAIRLLDGQRKRLRRKRPGAQPDFLRVII